MPLGNSALAGTPYPIDRAELARELGFSAPTLNSLDGVSDRDFAADFLYALSMVGTLEKGRTLYALVKTPERDIYQVRQGNHMGQNYGVIVGITDTEIKLKELMQDGAGDWSERSSTLNLLQADQKQERKQ